MKKNKLFCTIFTPTYNRADLLKRLYNSLLNQTDNDFEWLIVDDGSNDNTEEIIDKFKTEKKIFIRYYKQSNGGKHRAINNGIDKANGEVFAIVDSDDYLVKNAVEKIKNGFKEIIGIDDKLYAGIAFQRGYKIDEAIGTSFSNINYLDAKSTERRKNNINGDKFEIFYTNVLKNNKFPEYLNEKFMTEAIVWTRIANAGFYIRWYNDIVYICNYLDGGLTDTRDKLIEESPKGYALYIKEQVEFGNITLKQKLGFYSYYANIRKKKCNLKKISKELNTSVFNIYISLVMRRIVNLFRRKNE